MNDSHWGDIVAKINLSIIVFSLLKKEYICMYKNIRLSENEF